MFKRSYFKNCPKCKSNLLNHGETQTECIKCTFVMFDNVIYDKEGNVLERK